MSGWLQKLGLMGSLILLVGLLAFPATAHARTRVLFGDGPRIVSVPPTGGQRNTIFEAQRGVITWLTGSRSGRTIAFTLSLSSSTGRIRTLIDQIWVMRGDGGGAHKIRQFTRKFRGSQLVTPDDGHGSPYGVFGLDISDDGRRLVMERGYGGYVHILGLSGKPFRFVDLDGFLGAEPEFAPGGDRLIMHVISKGGGDLQGIGIASASGGRVRLLRAGPAHSIPASIGDPTFSDDGRSIAFVGRVGKLRRERYGIWTMRPDGSHPKVFNATNRLRNYFSWPDFAPNGRSLIMTRGIASGGDPKYSFTTIRRDGTHLRTLLRPSGFFAPPIWIR